MIWRKVIEGNFYDSNLLEKFFGMGRGGFAQKYGDITFDSDFFYILNQFGIIGVLLSILFLTLCFFYVKKPNLYYILFILACIFSSLFIDLITNVKVLFMIFIILNIFKNENRISLR